MLPRTVRGVVEAAAGVVGEVGRLVAGTAASVLEKAGVDVTEVERRLGDRFPPSVETLQTLAGEAVTAGRAGVDLAVGVARSEAEKVFEKVGDQVTKVGVVLAYLEAKLREVEEEAPSAASGPGAREAEEPVPAPRAGDLFGRGWEFEDEEAPVRVAGEPIVAERVEVDEPVEVDPPVPSGPSVPPVPPVPPVAAAGPVPGEQPAAKKRAAGKDAAGKDVPGEDVPGKDADGRSAAKKPAAEKTAKKAAAKKAAAKKAADEKAADEGTAARKATTGKAAAKRTTTVKKTATAQPAEDRAGTPAKRAATRRTTVRKATSTRKPDDSPKKPDARDE
ncbi:hypothetical protein ACH5AR_32550 [Kitasatospora sp. NPDC018619]|uniref:hypothetical protein n=1 Tax=unclassified Kitasatospora TaxID=2633591 RepID=UPI0037B79EBB